MSTILVNHTQKKKLNHPPGPNPPWPFGIIRQFQGRPLAKMEELAAQYGDAVRFRAVLHFYGYFFFHPDHNKHILQDNNKNYTKLPHPSLLLLTPVVGNGLLTSDGDFWRRQRRLAQPAFHRQRIATFATTMTEATSMMLEKWQDGQALNLAEEMMHLTLEIAGKTLFSIDLTRKADTVGEAFTAVNAEVGALSSKPFAYERLRYVSWWHSTRVIRQNTAVLDNIVQKIITERRQSGAQKDDLLGMLMAARDEESGEGMDDRQLRDEVMTILLAGHETTAVALSWVFYLLSQHPAVRVRLEQELADVLGNGDGGGGRVPTVADIPQLPYTTRVIEETMRLYPPAFALGRFGHEADVVGGYDVPANAVITLSPYLTHRHPDFWEEPLKFDPERFAPERVAERPRYAYLPFGGGPRQCIGSSFAMTEAVLLLATIARRFRAELKPGHQVEMEPLITLRPKGGLPMILRGR
ncbi:MAG: cytochrome P450 [Anaerolineae bacterium]|nr:cytochrome P450 [Anaerolineae bacterium]